MAFIYTSLRRAGYLLLSVDVVIVGSDITFGLSIVSVFSKAFLGAREPHFLCFTSPSVSVIAVFSGYKLPVLIASYLQIRTLEIIAVIITRNNVFSRVMSVVFDHSRKLNWHYRSSNLAYYYGNSHQKI